MLSIACTAPAPESAAPAPLDLSSFEVVDLSHSYGADTLYWPTDTQGFRHDELAFGPAEGGYFWCSLTTDYTGKWGRCAPPRGAERQHTTIDFCFRIVHNKT